MISSGTKRGLATAAVSALAIAGIPALATSASATPIVNDYGTPDGTVTDTDYELLNPDSATAQVTTSSYDIVVAGNTDVAAIQIRFTPTAGAVAVVANRVERVNGAFTYAWTPTASGTLTVVPFDAAGDLVEAEATTTAINANLPGNADTAQIGGGADLGVWNTKATTAGANAYTVGVTGTTSLTDTTSLLDDGYRVLLDARTGSTGTATADVTGATTGAFAGVLPLTGYAFTPGGPDQIVIGAEPQDATAGVDGPRANVEDAAVKVLYLQQLASVTATAAGNNLPPGETTTVSVEVKDQNGAAIAGATVYKSANGASATVAGTTDAAGKLLDNGGGAGLGSGSYKYFVNAPAAAVDNPQTSEESALGDKSSTVAIAVYTPALTAVNVVSKYGQAADLDEVDAGTPFTIKAVDQNGNPSGNESLHYTWTVTPFDGSPALTTNELGPVTTDNTATPAKGTASVRMADTTDFATPPAVLPSGKWTLKVYRKPVGGLGAFNATPVDYKFGESEIAWTPADVQGPQGGSVTVKGSLELEDGTALGSIDRDPSDPLGDINRTANLSYTAGTEQDNPATPVVEGGPGDSRIAPITEQDATVKTVPVGGLTATAQVNASGVVNVKINDANPETLEELNGNLTAVTSGDLDNDGISNVEVDFLGSVTADSIGSNFVGIEDVDSTGPSNPTPGRPGVVEFQVTNASGQTLSGKSVTLTVGGNAFFTDNVTGPYTVAQRNGTWVNNGKTITVETDANGYATATVAIERSAGLDDDFSDTVSVSAAVDGKSKSQPVVFKAWDAVNVESIDAVPTAGNTADLPDAQVDFETVEYNVTAKDQFGNLTREVFNAEDGDNGLAGLDQDTYTANTTTNGNLEAFANDATTQSITVTVPDRNGANADGVQTEAIDPINWYEVDFAASTFTLGQTGPESVPSGTRVTESLTAIDQKGHAIRGLAAKFLRSGPSDEDSDFNGFDYTDENGKAYYDFTGGSSGTARISVVVYTNYDPSTQTGNRVGSADDTVVFTGVIKPEPTDIGLTLDGKSAGKQDVVMVNASNKGAGLVAKLYKNGKLVDSGKLGAKGNRNFRIKDTNGNKVIKYTVKVAKTSKTKAATKSINIK